MKQVSMATAVVMLALSAHAGAADEQKITDPCAAKGDGYEQQVASCASGGASAADVLPARVAEAEMPLTQIRIQMAIESGRLHARKTRNTARMSAPERMSLATR